MAPITISPTAPNPEPPSESNPDDTQKSGVDVAIIFAIVGLFVIIALCWGWLWLRRHERQEATVQQQRDARVSRRRENLDNDEEIARVLAEGEVAPAYNEPGVTAVEGVGVVGVMGAGAGAAPRYEDIVEEVRRELSEVPPAYVK